MVIVWQIEWLVENKMKIERTGKELGTTLRRITQCSGYYFRFIFITARVHYRKGYQLSKRVYRGFSVSKIIKTNLSHVISNKIRNKRVIK
jgi:hypothetical protein